jgi:hypothetical protein
MAVRDVGAEFCYNKDAILAVDSNLNSITPCWRVLHVVTLGVNVQLYV